MLAARSSYFYLIVQYKTHMIINDVALFDALYILHMLV